MYNNSGNQRYNAWYTFVDINIGINDGHEIRYTPFDKSTSVGHSWGKRVKYIENTICK